MVVRIYEVKKKARVYCDVCECMLRGQYQSTKQKQFEYYLLTESGEVLAYRCQDLCNRCRKWLAKLHDRIVQRNESKPRKT